MEKRRGGRILPPHSYSGGTNRLLWIWFPLWFFAEQHFSYLVGLTVDMDVEVAS